ncbi:MAG: hypothetical protein AAB972_04145, partial [Patescibacteria group bacterium]
MLKNFIHCHAVNLKIVAERLLCSRSLGLTHLMFYSPPDVGARFRGGKGEGTNYNVLLPHP